MLRENAAAGPHSKGTYRYVSRQEPSFPCSRNSRSSNLAVNQEVGGAYGKASGASRGGGMSCGGEANVGALRECGGTFEPHEFRGPVSILQFLDTPILGHRLPRNTPILFNIEENQIPSARNNTSTARQHDEEHHLSSSSSPGIVMAVSASGYNFGFNIDRRTASSTDLQRFAGSHCIWVRNDPCPVISQVNWNSPMGNTSVVFTSQRALGNAAAGEMNNHYILNVEDDGENIVTVPKEGNAMIQKQNSNSPDLEHRLQTLQAFFYWLGGLSFAGMVSIICAVYSGQSAKEKQASMAVGGVGCAGIFFSSLLFTAYNLCQSASLRATLKFIGIQLSVEDRGVVMKARALHGRQIGQHGMVKYPKKELGSPWNMQVLVEGLFYQNRSSRIVTYSSYL